MFCLAPLKSRGPKTVSPSSRQKMETDPVSEKLGPVVLKIKSKLKSRYD
jgi:hypothetical protein